jgi:hypothetical protein
MTAARLTWPNYYPLAHGVVFVVDVHDVTRLTEARQVLQVLVGMHSLLDGAIRRYNVLSMRVLAS